ncbi:MAG: ParB N-terminal domain-containing protein [Desulfobacteraceae bacterium]|nr:ParB N-terminal domain-containing protein [Desulfobacteraceae bacterium]
MNHPINNIKWININKLDPNDYNPNVVYTPELKLLKLSLLSQGWIQHILVNKENGSYIIIDGFHRYNLVKTPLWPESYFKMALSRLSLPGAKFFCTTNPDSPYHWLKTEYIDRKHELNMARFQFTLDDNPNLDPDYITELKKEYTGLWYKRFILGLWVLADGVVYDMWSDDEHAIDPLMDGREEQKFTNYIVSCDYGTNNPTVFDLFGFNYKLPVYLIKEYYWDARAKGRQKTDADYADDLVAFIRGIFPSAASFIAELRKRGIAVVPAKNDVLDGIRYVSNLISNKQFFVYRSNCPETLKEFFSYLWDTKAAQSGQDKPLKDKDHCMDMIRYAFLHISGGHISRFWLVLIMIDVGDFYKNVNSGMWIVIICDFIRM